LLAATTFLTPLGLTGPAFAQASADGGDAADLGEVIVTATRRAESIQKVPISVQALSTEKLQERQVKGLSDLVTLLPSVSFAGLGPGRQTTYFRGIVPAGGTYASVGYYLDDIPARARWRAPSGSSPTSRRSACSRPATTSRATSTALAPSGARSSRT